MRCRDRRRPGCRQLFRCVAPKQLSLKGGGGPKGPNARPPPPASCSSPLRVCEPVSWAAERHEVAGNVLAGPRVRLRIEAKAQKTDYVRFPTAKIIEWGRIVTARACSRVSN